MEPQTQHRFPEAIEVAQAAARYDPGANRTVADIQMELGDVEAAERALAVDPPKGREGDLNYLALCARVEALHGRNEAALKLLREACAVGDERSDMPAETVAWTHTMVGHTLIDSGKRDEGERSCKAALAAFPRDYRAMTGLAEAAAWRRDWAGALAWARKAVAISPQNPEAIRLIGDALDAQGNAAEAGREHRRLEDLAHSFPRIYDRHWILFCADTGRNLDEALALARKDLGLRRDVLAYDTLAWVCLKKGPLDEADDMSREALARGVQDAGEAGISGRTVFLDLNRDGQLDGGDPVTTTASDGSFQFAGLAPGSYLVDQVLPAGWHQSSPRDALPLPVSVVDAAPYTFTFAGVASVSDTTIPAYHEDGFTFTRPPSRRRSSLSLAARTRRGTRARRRSRRSGPPPRSA